MNDTKNKILMECAILKAILSVVKVLFPSQFFEH